MQIVNDVLDFSKIESGKLELNMNLVHLLIDRLLTYLAIKQTKNIDLVLNLNSNVPKHILADSVRLKQVMVNLLSNALKLSFGEIRLDVDEIAVSNKKIQL
jgi:signal transduction histidine kinase